MSGSRKGATTVDAVQSLISLAELKTLTSDLGKHEAGIVKLQGNSLTKDGRIDWKNR
jgi:hypothetical protein